MKKKERNVKLCTDYRQYFEKPFTVLPIWNLIYKKKKYGVKFLVLDKLLNPSNFLR